MDQRPFTTTFYSYKGGVGRTTLAANVAVALARVGKTLLWDLDVEAPGLEQITALKTHKPVKRGYFGALVEWQKAQCPSKLGKVLLKPWDAALVEVQAQPGLFLLPAAPDTPSQVRDYIALDWAGFFGREPEKGLGLIDALLAHWAEAGFEFVVIDSRTGVTDLGALLTALVPDVTVLVGNFSVQNVYGLRLAWQALQPATGEMDKRVERGLEPLVRELVASPIPQDAQRLAAAYKVWEKHFGLRPAEWIEIPENEALRFSEAIALLEYPQDHVLVQKYQEVARRVLAARERQQAAQHADASASALYPELMPVRRGLLHPGERGREAQERGRRFEDQVAHVLQLLRHTVERETLVDANRIDLIASTSGTLEDVTWFVECKETSVTKDMVDKLALWVQDPQARARNARAMIVGRSFAPAALQQARNRNVQCFTLAQLEERLFNFKPYLAQLRAGFEQGRLAQCYVSQYVKRNRTSSAAEDESPDGREELLPLAVDWATGKGRPLWVLLGDYGTGKTAFTQRFAYELARRGETDPATPVPLLINLRDYPNATSLETVIDEHLAKTGQERGRAGAILHLLAQGRCVLLLDSFDEMGLAAVGVSVEEQFRQLARPTTDLRTPAGGRVLVTCREEFFKERKEAEAAISGSGDRLARPGSALEQAAKAFDAQIDALPYFDHEQVREYLEKRLGEREAAEALERIDSIHGLSDLATRPQLLEIVLESLPELVRQGKAVSPGVLYYTYVNRWLQRYRPVGARLSVGQVVQLLELLAQTLWARGAAPLHYSELAKTLHSYQALFPQIDPVHVDLELRTAAFLTRSQEGLYRFSHRSFLEFFYARRLLALGQEESGAELVEALAAAPLRLEVVRFFVDLWFGNGHKQAFVLTAKLMNQEQPPMVSANLFRLAYWFSKQAVKINEGRSETIGTDCDAENMVLTTMLPAAPAQTYLAGANLSGMDFSGVRLKNVVFDCAILDECNFYGAQLTKISFKQAHAYASNFSNALCVELEASELEAVGSIWRNARIMSARFCDSDLRNTDWRCTEIQKDDFNGANLKYSLLSGEHFRKMSKAAVDHASLVPHDFSRAKQKLEAQWRQISHNSLEMAAISPNGDIVASGGDDGIVRLWDALSGKELRHFEGHLGGVFCVAFSPDGKHLASGGSDGKIVVWELLSGRNKKQIDAHQDWVVEIAFSSDGRYIVSGGSDGILNFWEVAEGKKLQGFIGHTDWIRCIAISTDGLWIGSGADDGSIKVWNIESGKQKHHFETIAELPHRVAFSPDSHWFVCGRREGGLQLIDVASGEQVRHLKCMESRIYSTCFSCDGNRLYGGSEAGKIYVWNVMDGKLLQSFGDHQGSISSISLPKDDSYVLCSSYDIMQLWELGGGRKLQQYRLYRNGFHGFAYSRDGALAAAGDEEGHVWVWNPNDGQMVNVFECSGRWAQGVVFSPDSSKLMGGCEEGGIHIWDISSGQELRRMTSDDDWVLHAAFSSKGGRLVVGNEDNAIKVLDVNSNKILHTSKREDGYITVAAISADGSMVALGGENGVTLWDLSSDKKLCHFDCNKEWLQCIAFSPDGGKLACGCENGAIHLWGTKNGKKIHEFECPYGSPRGVAFSEDGAWIACGSDTGVVQVWSLKSKEELHRFNGHGGGLNGLAFSPDGSLAVFGGMVSVYSAGALKTRMDKKSWSYQIRITPTGDPVTLYPDGTHYGEGEALEWLEYAEYGLKPDGTPDPIPTLHRATDAPWLRRGPVKEEEKVKKGRKRK